MSAPRILVVRTDRMGDLILSTPVVRALRRAFPEGYLAMMTAPAYRELVEGLSDLNDVIAYDKDETQKSWWATWSFALKLKAHRFDAALILHSTNRVLLATWLAGIPRRIGYRRRLPFLLTQSFPYIKREGLKHELDYNLDLLQFLGVQSRERALAISVTSQHEERAAAFLRSRETDAVRPLIALHPGASCPSKRWPAARFAAVADRLAERYNAQVIVVTGPGEEEIGQSVIARMRHRPMAALGTLSPGELGALLRRTKCLISNDSGPVHLACAVGTPVVAIFGRWGGGLSPTRWGPTGEKSAVIHHDVGCRPCLAHRCPIGFACLDAISVDEVLTATLHLAGLKCSD